jgi:hypothetical protein
VKRATNVSVWIHEIFHLSFDILILSSLLSKRMENEKCQMINGK